MGLASIILGVLSFLFMLGGFLFAWVKVLGTLLSFAAPLLGLAGIVTGGIGLSRAKQDGQPNGAPMAGLIVSILAFIPAVLVALTCGLCNACMTAGSLNPNNGNFRIYTDGGMNVPHDPSTVPDSGAMNAPLAPAADPVTDPRIDPGAPPPALPPPPMDPPPPTEAAPPE